MLAYFKAGDYTWPQIKMNDYINPLLKQQVIMQFPSEVED